MGDGQAPSQVLGEKMRATRLRKGWTSQQRLADRLAELGISVDRSVVARLEAGTRGVQLDEASAIAAALGVSPLALLLPDDPEEMVALAPKLKVRAEEARAWFRGDEPLPGQDRHFFEANSDAWVEVTAWRRQRALFTLVARLADAWEHEDVKELRATLSALEEAVGEQRHEVAALERAGRG